MTDLGQPDGNSSFLDGIWCVSADGCGAGGLRRGLGMQLGRVMGAAAIREMVVRITMIAAINLMVSVGV